MVECSTNKLLLFPVHDRTEKTLLPIIKRHVAKGSIICSDGWRAYGNLNEHGYEYFSVLHKEAFKATYENMATGKTIGIHTNRIEGAWAHAKAHFRRINGTSKKNFV